MTSNDGVAGESAHNAGLGSAEIAAPGPVAPSLTDLDGVTRHLHAAETYGDGFYINGSRHKAARCRSCGAELEPRRVG